MLFFAFASTLTLGPASMSLPEVATALTNAGMPTEAAGTLRSRAAFVCLKDRSPEETRKLLREALDVAFQPRKGGGWLMIADPEAQERDRRFTNAYMKVAGKAIRNWMDEGQQQARGWTYERLKIWAMENADKVKATATEEGVPVLQAMSLLSPMRWTMLHQSATAATWPETVRRKATHWTKFAATGLPADAFPGADNPPKLEDDVELSLEFDAVEGVFGASGGVWCGETEDANGGRARWSIPISGNEGYVWVPAETEGVAATFEAMGKEAQTYLASLSPQPELTDTEPLESPPRYFSLALEDFGREAVMELSPRFEDVPRAWLWQSPARVTWKTLFEPVPLGMVKGSEPLPNTPAEDAKAALRHRAERRFPLRVFDRSGVWLVVNPYRFLDRAQPVSPVPFLRTERILKRTPKDAFYDFGGNLMPTWEMAVRLYRAVRPESTLRGTQEHFGYRDVSLHEASLLEPLIPAIEAMSPPVRKAFWRTLATEGKAVLDDGNGPISLEVAPFSRGPKEPKGGYSLNAKRMLAGSPIINVTAFFDGRGSLVP